MILLTLDDVKATQQEWVKNRKYVYGILGDIASINVEDLGDLELWYGTQYRVKLGNAGSMEKKIGLMCGTIQRHDKEGSYQSGILDITFEIYPDAVGYEPFQ